MSNEQVEAGPTKRFFVRMLTRDIDLHDAILDLLDNCIDGVLRCTEDNGDAERPYDGYWANITATPEKFIIEDNCGGIPLEIARNHAFMLGRPDDMRDAELPTVGMYGIGMKRAIFKLGLSAEVRSQDQFSYYRVPISEEWLNTEGLWQLPILFEEYARETKGTTIHVDRLYPNIANQFDDTNSDFLATLQGEIARLYALILGKGFRVTINGEEVFPVDISVLTDRTLDNSQPHIAPYVFEGTINGVNVSLVVGFYRELASDDELDRERESPKSAENAGWTIICNDRIVLHADKSKVTGWGRGHVPRYHNQFISIAGTVTFTCNQSDNLPLNTTKRGIDASSDTYLTVLEYMTEGLKKFTDFTNKWKESESQTTAAFEQAENTSPADVSSIIPDEMWSTVKKLGQGNSGKRFVPNLPLPQKTTKNVKIAFFKSQDEVRKVSEELFGDAEQSPKEIGVECFDRVLREADE